MINLTRTPVLTAEQIVKALRKLAQEHPGQPVALIDDGGGNTRVVILNIFPTEDDWYTKSVPLGRLNEPSAALK